jgi:hypothetical protein
LCLDLDWVDDAAAECDRECGAEGGPRDEHEDRPGDPRVVEEQRRSRQIDTCWLTGTGASAAPWLGRGPPMSGRGRMRGWPRRRIPPLTPTAGHGIAPLPALARRRGRGGRAPAGRRAEPRPLDEFHRDTYRDAFIALVELPPLAGARADNSAISSPELTPSRTKSLMSRECRGVPIRQVLNADDNGTQPAASSTQAAPCLGSGERWPEARSASGLGRSPRQRLPGPFEVGG